MSQGSEMTNFFFFFWGDRAGTARRGQLRFTQLERTQMSACLDRLRSPSRGWRVSYRMARHLECPWQLGRACDTGFD